MDIKEVIAKLKAEKIKVNKMEELSIGYQTLRLIQIDTTIRELEKYLESEKPEDKCGFSVPDWKRVRSELQGQLDKIDNEIVYRIDFLAEELIDFDASIYLKKNRVIAIIEALINALKVMKD